MSIYLTFIALCMFGIATFELTNAPRKAANAWFLLLVIYLFVITAFRYSVGSDYASYLRFALDPNSYRDEVLYGYLNKIASTFIQYPRIIFIFAAIINCSILFITAKLIVKRAFFIFLFMLFTSVFFANFFNILRSGLASSMFILGISLTFLFKTKLKERLGYIIPNFIGIGIHSVALISIPAYFFRKIELTKRHIIYLALLATILHITELPSHIAPELIGLTGAYKNLYLESAGSEGIFQLSCLKYLVLLMLPLLLQLKSIRSKNKYFNFLLNVHLLTYFIAFGFASLGGLVDGRLMIYSATASPYFYAISYEESPLKTRGILLALYLILGAYTFTSYCLFNTANILPYKAKFFQSSVYTYS